jgi:hypothetical protein
MSADDAIVCDVAVGAILLIVSLGMLLQALVSAPAGHSYRRGLAGIRAGLLGVDQG